MRVYRLESLCGNGIFYSGIVGKAWAEWNSQEPDPYRHPNPWQDVPGWSLRDDREEFFCGFSSVEHLAQWFDSERLRVEMNKLGAVMRVFEVDDSEVLHGTAQIMFRKSVAALVDTLPVPTLSA
jgi:hypothetical protein